MPSSSPPPASVYDRVKRVGDALVAGGALLVLSPVVLGTALLVRVKLGRNVLFRQERPGLHGQLFTILKFRTMLDPDPDRGLMTNEERMTPFGDRLRATSLDELPGLINVLRGEMSLVGPRPLRTPYLERYSREQARRHEVLPGLTGLAQVSGRNALSWDDRFELDLRYVRTRSLSTDLGILLATVPKVFRREGIAEEGQATMSEFFGPRRIGVHEIRPVGEAGTGGPWEIVDRRSGGVVARCELDRVGAAGRAMRIEVDRGAAEPELIRHRAAEMLVGLARELDADTVHLAVAPEDGPCEGARDRWGFRPEREAVGSGPITWVRTLGGSGG